MKLVFGFLIISGVAYSQNVGGAISTLPPAAATGCVSSGSSILAGDGTGGCTATGLASGAVVTLTGTQILTNKDIAGGQITGSHSINLATLPLAIPNANLANSATTVNGQSCTLGSTCTVSAIPPAQATATVLANISGGSAAPTAVSIPTSADVIGTTSTGQQILANYNSGATGSANRTFTSKSSDIVSVKDFGAVGDGVTDDRANVQKAIDSLTNGGTVCFPSGTYLMDSAVQITAGDRFNLWTSHDNLSFSPCSGSPAGSVKLLQGTNGWGDSTHPVFGPIAIYNSGFFNTSTVGMNGYNNTTQNGGYYTLSAIATGAMSVTFSTPADTSHFIVGDWIAVAASTTQGGTVVPLELNQVTSINSGTGVVGLKWPQTEAYATAFAAMVTPMVRQNISVDGLIVQSLRPIFMNCTYNTKITNTQFISDTTYFSNAKFMFANAVKQAIFSNNQFSGFPVATSSSIGSMEGPQNNSSDILFDSNQMDVPAFGQAEYVERIVMRNNKISLNGSTSPAFTFSGFGNVFETNTIYNNSSAAQVFADYSGNTNPFAWVFGAEKVRGNRIFSYPTGTTKLVNINLPDTEISGNLISGGPTQHVLTLTISGTPVGNVATSTITPQNVVSGNTFVCNQTGSLGCVTVGSSAIDGGLVSNNTFQGINSSTFCLWLADPGSPPATGAMAWAGNTFSNCGTNKNYTIANHPGLSIIDQDGVQNPSTFIGTGIATVGTRSTVSAPSSGAVGSFTVTDSNVTGAGSVHTISEFTNGSNNGVLDTGISINNQTTGGRKVALLSSSTGSGTGGTGHAILYDLTNAQKYIDCNSVYSCAFQAITNIGLTQSKSFGTSTNCANAAGTCASAAAGAVTIAAGSTTVVVATTAVTANSRIFLTPDDTVTIAATTCNSTLATLVGGLAVTARTAGTSFTISYNGVIATNPLCISYSIIN